MEHHFVVRDTDHPEQDMARNWSAAAGGWHTGDFAGSRFLTAEAAAAAWERFHCGDAPAMEFRYHPAHESFVPVHYEGLGAWLLEADNLPDALAGAAGMKEGLACTTESGDGHFFAHQVVSFHQVRDGRWVFEIRDTEY